MCIRDSYWIRDLGATSWLGGAALTLQLAGGVLGTLLGGRIADRIGLVRTVRWGNALLAQHWPRCCCARTGTRRCRSR